MIRPAIIAALAFSAVAASRTVRADPKPQAAEQPSEAPPEQAPPPAPSELPPPPEAQQAPAQDQPSSASGQWVYTTQYGWVWIPYGDEYVYTPADQVGYPQTYVYYPEHGWTWVIAPWIWGWGPTPYFGYYGPSRYHWYRAPGFVHPGFRGGTVHRPGIWYRGNRGGFRGGHRRR